MITLLYKNTLESINRLFLTEKMSRVHEYVYAPTVSGLYLYLERVGSRAGMNNEDYTYRLHSVIKPKFNNLFLSQYTNNHYSISRIDDIIDYTTYYRFSKSPKSVIYHRTEYTHFVKINRRKESIVLNRYGDKNGIFLYSDMIYQDTNTVLTSDYISNDILASDSTTIQNVFLSPKYLHY